MFAGKFFDNTARVHIMHRKQAVIGY
jgi:hypothetical protein